MSDFLGHDNHEEMTEAAQAHILQGKAPEGHPGMRAATNGMPKQNTYAGQTPEGEGVNFTPASQAGHKAP